MSLSHTPKTAIVILAAGAASRMGQPKQLLEWGKHTLLTKVIETANATTAAAIYVVLGANYDTIHPTIKTKAVQIIKNEHWAKGLGKSIACAAEFLLKDKEAYGNVLYILADQPFVSATFLNTQMHAFKRNAKHIVATRYSNTKLGVPVLFDVWYLKILSQLEADDGAKALLKAYKPFVEALQPEFKPVDIDTVEDYNKYLPYSKH